jgi:urease accessory protein
MGGLASGLVHPLHGVDHMLATLVVGALGATADGRALWALPASFVAAVLAGGALGISGVALPAVEAGIALSLVVFGALLALGAPLRLLATTGLVGALGIPHGHAHGAEASSALAPGAYLVGLVMATGALHGVGAAAARALGRTRLGLVARLAGASVALAGVALFAS